MRMPSAPTQGGRAKERSRTSRRRKYPAAPDAEPAGVVPRELALAQQEKSTWPRADLVTYLGRVLPRSGRDPARAAALLEAAGRILRSESGPVRCLEALEPAGVPRALLRADGRSVHRRHGGVRYATRAQLSGRPAGRAGSGAGRAASVARRCCTSARLRYGTTCAYFGRPRERRARRAAHRIGPARRPGRRRAVRADRRPPRFGDRTVICARRGRGAGPGELPPRGTQNRTIGPWACTFPARFRTPRRLIARRHAV